MSFSQTAREFQNATRELPIQTRVGRPLDKRHRELPVPALIWTKEFENSPTKFLRVIQELSDALLLGGPTLYHNNINQGKLVDAVEGKLNDRDYYNYEYAFGNNSNMPLRDNSFFYAAKETLTSQVTSQPFEFNVKNISDEYSQKLIDQMAKKTARLTGNLLAEYAAANGMDLSFIKDNKVNMAGTKDEIIDRLKEGEKLEYILHKLILDIHYKYDLEQLAEQSFSSKFDVNAQFAHIEVVGDEIIPKSVRPDQVLWIAGKKVETMEDKSVMAACVVDYLTFTEIMQKYAFHMDTGTGAAGLQDAWRKLQKNRGLLGPYNPNRPYFTEYMHGTATTSSERFDGAATLPLWNGVDYMANFYPFQTTAQGLAYTILEQQMYFKMLVNKRYVVEFNGKPGTEKQYEKWRTTNYDGSLVANFTEVDAEEKPPKGAFTVDKPKVELWQATRIGHGDCLNVKRYEWTTTKKNRDGYVGMPIVAQISYDRSFAYLGYPAAIWTNVISKHIDEIMSQLGLSTAVLMDMDTGIDPLSFLYNAKKTGAALYNSSKLTGTQQSNLQHLSTIKLGHHVEELNNMFAMMGMIKIAYENVVGASPQVQGIQQPYSGARETQMNVTNQSQLAQKKFGEHGRFMNQVLQRIADIAKQAYAREGIKTVRLSNGEREILRLNAEINSIDPDVKLFFGFDLQKKKDRIIGAVENVMASGGIDMFEALLDLMDIDSPNEAKAIFRKHKDQLIQLREQQSQAMMQQAQAQAQLEAQKLQVPIATAKIGQETAFGVQQMKMEERARSEEDKGMTGDIRHEQDKDRRILEAQLAMDASTHDAALNSELQSQNRPEK